MPEKFAWADQTALHPLGLAAVVVLGIALLVLPRRYAAIPMILMACFVSSRQRLVIATLDFTLLRIMVLLGLLRVFARGEARMLRMHSLDWVLVWWAVVSTLTPTVRHPSLSTLVNVLGASFDALGMYFLFRLLLRSWRDIRITIMSFAVISIPTAIAFLVENNSGRNLFSVFGGVPEFTMMRQGRLRCQGAFSHPILAGCFWASVIPLIAAQWWRRDASRLLVVVGVICSLLTVFLSASSTPVGGVVVVLIGGALFFARRHMRIMRWGIAVTLVGLHMVMNAPVWHLIARIDLVSGSTGWHRYQLIDRMIRRVDEWWLVGTDSTAHWGHLTTDITNQFVLEGAQGGIVTLGLFIATIAIASQLVGRIWRTYGRDRSLTIQSWALGVSLYTHVAMFVAVSYFGQITLVWYLLLAVIGSLGAHCMRMRGRARLEARNRAEDRPTAVESEV